MNKKLNFGGIPEDYIIEEKAATVILSAPYDETSTWMKGADKGPEAIIDASVNIEWYDIETGTEVYKKGIYTAPLMMLPKEPEQMVKKVEEEVSRYLLKDKFIVGLGGEHSVTAGFVNAMVRKYPDLTVLQFDAHSDLRASYLGSPYNHACVMSRVKEKCSILQAGIRSMDVEEVQYIDPERIVYAREINTGKNWKDKLLDKLGKHVYITIDLDVFDPSLVPSTGTPEPGGLFYHDVMEFIRNVMERSELVGFDVVELCPNELNKAPDYLAAKLIYQIISNKLK